MSPIKELFILCGGASKRMGQDKFNLDIQGQTFLELMLSKTQHRFDKIILLGANRNIPAQYQRIPDAIENTGPLGGLLAALKHSENEAIAIIPVDLPLLSESTIAILSGDLKEGVKAMVAESGENVQPLVGSYKTSLTAELEDYLKSGKRSVMGFLNNIEHGTFKVAETEIANINTPQDYDNLLKGNNL